MVRTRVGYSGGTKNNPTYRNLGDHTETVQVDYDPAQISYEELLRLFWASHYPGASPWSRQYMAAVFYHDEEQRRVAEQSKERVAARLQAKVCTRILPASEFYLAEDYHQKYYLRQVPLLERELLAIYPDLKDCVGSTLAARVNGYAAGYGTLAALREELESLGLSSAGKMWLLQKVAASDRGKAALGCPIPNK